MPYLSFTFLNTTLKLLITIVRQCSAIVMITAIAGTTFSKAIALLDYRLNEKYIASSLCENRNRPACCCHGKCFLKKQLQKDEDGKNSFPFSKDKSDVSLFCQFNESGRIQNLRPQENFRDRYLDHKYSSLLAPVFHPPKVQIV